MRLPLLKNTKVFGKTVFLRADLDVPLSEVGSEKSEVRIEDDTRLLSVIPTIEYLLQQKCKIIIAGHLGRPKPLNQESGIKNQEFSLLPVARWLTCHSELVSESDEMLKRVQHDISKVRLGEFDGWEIMPNLFLLENLRFYEGEEKNDPKFTKKLADLADVYVNDAFAVSHRIHASIVGITKFLPSFAGLHLEKEVSVLSKILINPKQPLIAIVGGKKVETKLPLIARMYFIADYILVGGKIAQETKEFLKIEHQKTKGKKAILLVADINEGRTGILENSLNNFIEIIGLAKTVVWNGTMGMVVDHDDFNHATKKVALTIIKSKAYSVVGGGDTTEFLRKLGLINKFSFSSTGGGAMLAFLSGERLPGLVALGA